MENLLRGSFDETCDFSGDIISLFLYCMEGDNRPHGRMLAALVSSLLIGASEKEKSGPVVLKEPVSWCVFEETYDSHAAIF